MSLTDHTLRMTSVDTDSVTRLPVCAVSRVAAADHVEGLPTLDEVKAQLQLMVQVSDERGGAAKRGGKKKKVAKENDDGGDDGSYQPTVGRPTLKSAHTGRATLVPSIIRRVI